MSSRPRRTRGFLFADAGAAVRRTTSPATSAALAAARGENAERRAHLEAARALWVEMGSEPNAARVEKLLAQAS